MKLEEVKVSCHINCETKRLNCTEKKDSSSREHGLCCIYRVTVTEER